MAAASIESFHASLENPSELRERFERDGFVVVPDFVTAENCSMLRSAAKRLANDFDPSKASIFTTDEQQRNSDEYFLTSGDKIRCFLEPQQQEEGDDKAPIELVNKIGHDMHELDDDFRAFSKLPQISKVVEAVGYKNAVVPQSMYIFKHPKGVGGEVKPHQDATFLHTTPRDTVMGLWFALEDADQENSCLWGVPGSHKGEVRQRFVLNDDGKGTHFEPATAEPFDIADAVPLEVKQGSLVLIHGRLVHFSHQNTSKTRSRHAYTLHIIEGPTEGVEWSQRNWLQRDTPFPAI